MNHLALRTISIMEPRSDVNTETITLTIIMSSAGNIQRNWERGRSISLLLVPLYNHHKNY